MGSESENLHNRLYLVAKEEKEKRGRTKKLEENAAVLANELGERREGTNDSTNRMKGRIQKKPLIF